MLAGEVTPACFRHRRRLGGARARRKGAGPPSGAEVWTTEVWGRPLLADVTRKDHPLLASPLGERLYGSAGSGGRGLLRKGAGWDGPTVVGAEAGKACGSSCRRSVCVGEPAD